MVEGCLRGLSPRGVHFGNVSAVPAEVLGINQEVAPCSQDWHLAVGFLGVMAAH